MASMRGFEHTTLAIRVTSYGNVFVGAELAWVGITSLPVSTVKHRSCVPV